MVTTPDGINLLGATDLAPKPDPQIIRVFELGQRPEEEAEPTTSQDCNIGPNGNMPLTELPVQMYFYIYEYLPRVPVAAAPLVGDPR
jgi:hypothetical protein